MNSYRLSLSKAYYLLATTMLAISVSQTAMAETCHDTDRALATHYNDMDKYSYSNYKSTSNTEKEFNQAADNFSNAVADYIVMDVWDNDGDFCPLTLAKKSGINVKDSDDGKFRMVSWNELTGGTMRFYNGFIQYKSKRGSHVLTDVIEGNVLDLQTLTLPQTSGDSRTVYAVIEHYTGSSRDHAESIKLYEIDDKKLIYPKVIKTKSGTTNQIYFSFDTVSFDTLPINEVDDFRYPLIRLNKAHNMITFPVVIETDKYPSGQVTNRKIKYQFRNAYFRKVAP